MPGKTFETSKRKVTLDARPDRPDLRDRIYLPPLRSLPPQYPPPEWIDRFLPAYCEAGLVLDQGEEGACTGFGLAALVNYLLYRQAVTDGTLTPTRVSTRMLYHLARKYDEWPGEDYEGSSCRGAMKGWFHHGVCDEDFWPYRNKKKQVVFLRPQSGWDQDAARRPVGAYYRVMTDSIPDLQAAIVEVGAVYASADVHDGWNLGPVKSLDMANISWKPGTEPNGGHAFALVGYDAVGFIVQNSWGDAWGYQGFGRLFYDDWLTNAADAWVAVLGAPIAARAPNLILSSSRTVPTSATHLGAGLVNGATAEVAAQPTRVDMWDTPTAVRHALILGNQGLPDQVTIDDENGAAAAERVCHEFPAAWLADRKKGDKRIAVYVHGGLNPLGDGLARTSVMGPWFEQNGVYPIFVVWQSGYLDSIKNILGDLVGDLVGRAAEPRKRKLFEVISEARDYLIETAAIPAARPIWSEMKENAIAASRGNGGMAILAKSLAALAKDHGDLEIHLVGHSAGAIALGAFLSQFKAKKLAAETVSLYAPACTVEFAAKTYLSAARAKVIDPKTTVVDLLSDLNEADDTVGEIYGKSLLYLVSRALESVHKTPLLGMEAAWNPAFDGEDIFARRRSEAVNRDVAEWRDDWLKIGSAPEVLAAKEIEEATKPRSTIDASHGCFDNWVSGVERTLARILGVESATKLPVRITSLKGF